MFYIIKLPSGNITKIQIAKVIKLANNPNKYTYFLFISLCPCIIAPEVLPAGVVASQFNTNNNIIKNTYIFPFKAEQIV